MENAPEKPNSPFESRVLALQKRVNEAALALHERGLKPTVARVRAALGGGSPNDLGPAVKHWKEEVLPALLTPTGADAAMSIPASIADLARELWIRAVAAAQIDKRGVESALQIVARSEEVAVLRQQIVALREEITKDAVAYGEVRQVAARHEAIAKQALAQTRAAAERERRALITLGEAKQRIAELEAALRTTTRSQIKKRPSSRPPKRMVRQKAAQIASKRAPTKQRVGRNRRGKAAR